jgi:threonine synthase
VYESPITRKVDDKMCCANEGVSKNQVNGDCPACGMPVQIEVRQEFSKELDKWVEVSYFESSNICSYSPTDCEICGYSPCDQAC